MLRIFLLLLLLGFATAAQSASVTGKVSDDNAPVAGLRVAAYPVDALNFDKPHTISEATGEDGLFQLDLDEGQYYLLAQSEKLFSFYGRNPVSVPKAGLDKVNLLVLPQQPAQNRAAQPEEQSAVEGRVTYQGKPVAGAVVMVYPDLTSQFKGFGLGVTALTDEEGFYQFALPSGSYYIVVRQRKSGLMAGPLRAGDLFGYASANPIAVQEEQITALDLSLIEVPQKVERYAETLFGNTSIHGRIVDEEGKPVAGLMALLYDDTSMLNRPLFVSQPSDVDGKFLLSFPKGGIYYLAARDQLGGTPAPGELYGRYGGSPDHSLQVKTGKSLKDIEIVVEEVY